MRRQADLITANIWRLKRGERQLSCEDYFEPDSPEVTVELDPLLSPQSNAAKLYKQYNKLKTAEGYLTELIKKAEEQLDYIASVWTILQAYRKSSIALPLTGTYPISERN